MQRLVRFLAALFLCSLSAAAGAADGTYEVSKTDARGKVGAKATAQVTIVAKKGWHLNAEAPLTLKLTPGAAVAVDKAKLARADLASSNDTSARFDVGMTASAPGKQTVDAEAGFVLCQAEACRPIKEKLTLVLEADTAPAKSDAPAKLKKGTGSSKHDKGG